MIDVPRARLGSLVGAALVILGCGDAGGGGGAVDCGALAAATLDGHQVCLGAREMGGCPPGAVHETMFGGLRVCASSSDAAVDHGSLVGALTSVCGAGGVPTVGADAAGCVYITETGFDCPPLFAGRSAVGDWTICGPAGLDAVGALELGGAYCATAGEGVLATGVDVAGCAVAITETGFDCPPLTVPVHDDDQMGVCGAPDLGGPALTRLLDGYCGPGGDAQYLEAAGGRSACAYWITETGFLPCPAHHPDRRVAAPFGMCAGAVLDTGSAAQGRLEVCGAGALVDIGRDTVCAYAITETGFDCPPLLRVDAQVGGATVCGRSAAIPGQTLTAAAAFASAPVICDWVEHVGGAFNQQLAGVDPTPSGSLVTGSVSSLTPIALPGGEETLVTDAPHTLFAALLNVNGTLSGARIIARAQIELYTCGAQAVDATGRWYVGFSGSGDATFGEGALARTVALGDGATGVARYSPLGELEEVMVASASERADDRNCALAVDDAGTVTVLHEDEFIDDIPELLRFAPDGSLLWRAPAPAGTAVTVAAFAGGDFALAGSFEGALAYGSMTLNGDALADGFVMRLDDAGEPLWGARVGGRDEDAVLGLRAHEDALLVTGYVSLEAVWAVGQASTPVPAALPDTHNHLDTIVGLIGADGVPAWIVRAQGGGNNEGRSIALGLDGESVHVAGVSAGDVRFGDGAGAPSFEIDSRLFFYAGFSASFALADGAARSAFALSDAEPYFDRFFVVGHLDGSTTVAGNALGIGAYGVDPDARQSIGQEINYTIFLVHTPAEGCL